MQNNLILWLLFTPMISSVVVYVVGRFLAPNDTEKPNKTVWLCVAGIAATFVPFILSSINILNGKSVTTTIGDITLVFDGISMLVSLTVLILGLAVILFSVDYMAAEHSEEKFYGLLMILITSIIGLSTSTDLFNIYIWFELMAVSTYSLVAFYRNRATSLEAGIKYLTQSAAGSIFIILGIAMIFGTTGKISMQDIPALIASSKRIMIAAGACFITGYGIKCAFVPMHFWLPDAHSQAPSGVSAMLSGIVIETGLIALLRSLSALNPAAASFGIIFLLIGALNMLIGNLGALRQSEVKRMFAFSSISHMGYIGLGIGFVLTFQESTASADGVFFHIFNHAMMKGLAFLAAGAIVFNLKQAKGDHSPLMVKDLDGISQKYPWYALLLSIAVLALGGLPPLAGFISKWQIFAGGALSKNPWAIFLIVFAGINSVLSLGYYAPLVNHMYRHQPSQTVLAGISKCSATMMASLILLGIFVVLLGLFPMLISNYTGSASSALLNMFR